MPETFKDIKIMKHYPTPSNFIYPEIKPEDYRFGALGGEELRENGDWRDYLPPEEHQNIRGIESSACYIEAQQHAVATIEEETYGEIDNNYSARYNALLSDGSIFGGNPLKGGESIRKDGLIPDSLMPFGENIKSWEDFHSWKGVDEKECKAKGEEYLKGKVLHYEVVFEKHEPLATKFQKLRQSLKYSPVPISVSAWYEENGQYIKPEGAIDNHLALAVFVDKENRIHIRDTYAPFNKILAPNYNCDFAMRWTVRKKDPELEKQTFFALLASGLVKFFADWWKAFYNPPIPELPKPPEPPKPKTNGEKLHEEALRWVGKDASPDNFAPPELACAETVNYIFQATFGKPICSGNKLSTYWLWLEMKRRTNEFDVVLEPKEGDIIVSPTGTNSLKNVITHGHCGIFTKDGYILSNDSQTGIFTQNYTLATWKKRYRDEGGYPVIIFRVV